jgi:hypothetical protein
VEALVEREAPALARERGLTLGARLGVGLALAVLYRRDDHGGCRAQQSDGGHGSHEQPPPRAS